MPDAYCGRPRFLFPNPETASADGFIGFGADLEPDTLLHAYSLGIYPCFGPDNPILWWSPNPRGVLPLDRFHLSARSSRKIRRSNFQITFDQAFSQVINACAPARSPENGVWIVPEMISAYERLHSLGYAHSVETWLDGQLVGGLYGVSLGKAFFGESMFHRQNEASRAALAALVERLLTKGFHFIDCQDASPHMLAMGAVAMPRSEYLRILRKAMARKILY